MGWRGGKGSSRCGHRAGYHRRRPEGQRAEGLQQTVLVGSASSVLELLAMSWSSSALTSSCRTASTMGITMAVVDVLESHMESSVVQLMKQSSSLEGREGRLSGSSRATPNGPSPRAPAGPPTDPMVLA